MHQLIQISSFPTTLRQGEPIHIIIRGIYQTRSNQSQKIWVGISNNFNLANIKESGVVEDIIPEP